MKKVFFLLLLILTPSFVTAGCVETALVAVSVVNAVDSVADIAARHEARQQPDSYGWDGRNISDLFVAWGRPGQSFQRHPGNQFGGRSFIWEKRCGPTGETSAADYERRSVETTVCQVFVHTDAEDKIRELNPGPECGPCPELTLAQ
ncbi:MAG: hypothetical protein LBV79_01325 [Candidatus Adiutrix sp.]|jgi:hypothetical protein|nr:hypothetical protein [Candidatus Adiutrix sp.]